MVKVATKSKCWMTLTTINNMDAIELTLSLKIRILIRKDMIMQGF